MIFEMILIQSRKTEFAKSLTNFNQYPLDVYLGFPVPEAILFHLSSLSFCWDQIRNPLNIYDNFH